MTQSTIVRSLPQPDAAPKSHRIIIRDLVLPCRIGVHRHERKRSQPVRINVDYTVIEDQPHQDRLANVVCYEEIVSGIRAITSAGHINLVESLAEKIAELCLSDSRVCSVKVRVEKLHVFADAAGVGVEIERHNPNR